MTAETVQPTQRAITKVTQRERSYLLELECGHHRSIGGQLHPRVQLVSYACYDGHCGKATDHDR